MASHSYLKEHGAHWGWMTLDDFTLPRDTLLTEFHWYGAPIYWGNRKGEPAEPNVETWTLGVWEDAEGEPGKEIHSETKEASEVVSTKVASMRGFQRGIHEEISAFHYAFKLEEPLRLTAGRKYWIAPLARSSSEDPSMHWLGGVREDDLPRDLSSLGLTESVSWHQGADSNGAGGNVVPGERSMILMGRPLSDEDEDGMEDIWELTHGLNTALADGHADPDGDGASNLQEFERKSDPHDPDSDDDGLLDGVETKSYRYVDAKDTGTDPMKADTDGDGASDGAELSEGMGLISHPILGDTDRDGFGDGLEIMNGYDPQDAGSFPRPVILDSLLGNGLVQGGALIETSDGDSDSPALKAFDGSLGAVEVDWTRDIVAQPNVWLQAHFGVPLVLTHFTVSSASRGRAAQGDPDAWEIQGSNDGGRTFTTIFHWGDFRDNEGLWSARSQILRFDAGHHYHVPPAYSTIRFWSRGARLTGQFQLGEIEFFGRPYEPKINGIHEVDRNAWQVDWASVPGSRYAIERSADLIHWQEVYTGEGTVRSPETSVILEGGETPTSFFRVRELLPLRSTFEDGAQGWTSETTAGETQWGLGRVETSRSSDATDNHVWTTNPGEDYAPDSHARLRSPLIDLSGIGHAPVLSFLHFMDTPADLAGGLVRVLDETGTVIAAHETPITGSMRIWENFILVLPERAKGGMVQVEFIFLSDAEVPAGAGWHIDNVVIR